MIAFFTILTVARNGLTTGALSLSLLMISGWYDVLPEKYQDKLPLIVIALMFLLSIALWRFGILPIYYQPFLD